MAALERCRNERQPQVIKADVATLDCSISFKTVRNLKVANHRLACILYTMLLKGVIFHLRTDFLLSPTHNILDGALLHNLSCRMLLETSQQPGQAEKSNGSSKRTRHSQLMRRRRVLPHSISQDPRHYALPHSNPLQPSI